MNRRGFFGAVFGAVVAAAMPWQAPSAIMPRTGTIGAINRSDYAFWRNQQASGDSTSFRSLESAMRDAYNNCERMTT